jgi:hypothetical protein
MSVTYENLFLALKKAARDKRGPVPVAEFDFDENANLFQLQEELQAKTLYNKTNTSQQENIQ